MKKIRAWLPAVLFMGFIYMMSAAPGETSSAQSGLVVEVFLWVWRLFTGGEQPSPDALSLLSLLVRKAAHMSEYAVLALLYLRALRLEGKTHPFAKAFVLCVIYAASDEFHQAFVPGRGPSPVDVAIDAAGGALGLFFARIYLRLRP